MEKQKIFKSAYVRELKKGVKSGMNLDRYKSENFEINEERTLFFPNVHAPTDLLSSLDPNLSKDFENAVNIYEAYSDLELIQASDIRFWIYLSHADLYPYVKERWNGEINKRYVLNHWFIDTPKQSNLLGDNISRLWWAVHLSIDENRGIKKKYELTNILFKNRTFAFRTLGTSRLGRHKEAMIGILEFIKDNYELFENKFEARGRYVAKYLNQLGGIKPIAYYDRNFFKSALSEITGNIKLI
jgi:hypothetical protein